jgi:heat shock protein HslJ
MRVCFGLAAICATVALLFSPRTAAAANEAHLLSSRWSVTVLAGKTARPAGDITFGEGTVSGATACNFFRGTYEMSESGNLTITVGQMTRRGCSGIAANYERQFIEAMAATRRFAITNDQLSLLDAMGTTTAQLARTPDATLLGPRHKIVSYLMSGGLHSVISGSGAALQFKDGRIEGSTGCRPFTGSYRLDGKALTIVEIVPARTVAACAPELASQDQAILAALPAARTFDTNRNLVRLLESAEGNAVLWMTPVTD